MICVDYLKSEVAFRGSSNGVEVYLPNRVDWWTDIRHNYNTVLVGCSLAHGTLTRYLDGKVLQEAAESVWNGICVLFLESGLAKVRRMK